MGMLVSRPIKIHPLISLLPIRVDWHASWWMVEPQNVWEWEALGEMLFGFQQNHEDSLSLVGSQGRSHAYGKVWRLPYLNFPATPSPKSLPTISSASSRSSCCAELVLWMFQRSHWILNTSICTLLGKLGSYSMWALVYVYRSLRLCKNVT